MEDASFIQSADDLTFLGAFDVAANSLIQEFDTTSDPNLFGNLDDLFTFGSLNLPALRICDSADGLIKEDNLQARV